jgi:2-iminobutanoate/2-iminopropanoate deaminase
MTRLSFYLSVLCLGFAFSQSVTAQQESNAGQAQQPGPEYLTSPATTILKRPFSEAVRVGNMLYLSGFTGRIPGTNTVVPGGIQAETKQVMENIKGALDRYGSDFDHVVKCTVMLLDIKEWAAMNEVYRTYFPQDRMPARSAFATYGLAFGAKVEIECLATMK